jgi:hypothetical protein
MPPAMCVAVSPLQASVTSQPPRLGWCVKLHPRRHIGRSWMRWQGAGRQEFQLVALDPQIKALLFGGRCKYTHDTSNTQFSPAFCLRIPLYSTKKSPRLLEPIMSSSADSKKWERFKSAIRSLYCERTYTRGTWWRHQNHGNSTWIQSNASSIESKNSMIFG